ncbi:MAG: DUF1318 domain-containing protein [Desulfuromonas sp.]|mgnify:CR=1 FL=1|nr:MAG: DUF1318 domain-containing protein [Desulfuromonas sp.]
MKYLVHLLLCVLVFLAVPVLAIELQDAKEQGLVGETPQGYLEAVVSPNAEVKELLADINGKRKEKYQEIAAKNEIGLDKVEQLAGEKAIEKTPPGQYVKTGKGWQKK